MPIEPKVADALSKLLGERKGKKAKKKPAVGEPGSPLMGPPESLKNPPAAEGKTKTKPAAKEGRRVVRAVSERIAAMRRRPARGSSQQRPSSQTRASEIQEWNRFRRAEKKAGRADPGQYRGG